MTPIGSGGVGTVWRAGDMLLDREVAIKEIVRFVSTGPNTPEEVYQRTLTEARAAARIRHPGVAAVYDVLSEQGRPYIVMELIEGRPLSHVIDEQGPLDLPRVADVGRQVLAALAAGHSAGVLHRDLKPSNVLITMSGRAVLTDFGIASMVGSPSQTQTGLVLGTPGYMPPERARGEPATPAADMWSLGATLYAAAAGRGPYDGYNGALATLSAVLTTEPPQLSAEGPASALIHALMHRDPRQRPGATETARVLNAIADGRAGPGAAPPAAPARSRPDEDRLVAARQAPPEPRPMPEPRQAPPEPRHTPDPVWSESPGGDSDQWSQTVASQVTPEPARYDQGHPHDQGHPRERTRNRLRPRGRRTALVAGVTAAAAAVLLTTTIVLAANSSHSGSERAGLAGASMGVNDADPPTALAAAASPIPAVKQEFRVTAAVSADDTPALFARTRTGTLATSRFANGAWTGWANLPGGRIYTGVPAVARSHDGRLVVVARTTSGKLAYLWQSAPGSASWDGPVPLGSDLTSSDPAVVAGPGGHLEVFARLGDDSLGIITQLGTAATSRWSGWTSLGGDLIGPPVAAINADGDPVVFALGSGGSLMSEYFENDSWQAWQTLPGGAVFAGTPSVGKNFDGRLEVFARTRSGDLVHVWQLPGDREQWGGPLVLMHGITSDPAVYSTIGGRIEAFAVATDGSVTHSWQNQPVDGTAWSHQVSLGGAADGVVVPLRAGGQSLVFTRTPGGAIAADREMSQTWSGWSSLYGSF